MRANQRDAVLPFQATILAAAGRRAADATPPARIVQRHSGAGVGAIASSSALTTVVPEAEASRAEAPRVSKVRAFLASATRYTLISGVPAGIVAACSLPFWIGLAGISVGLGVTVASILALNLIWGSRQAA